MKFTDIVLDETDMAQIEAMVEEKSLLLDLDAHSRGIERQRLISEAKEGIWADRDYSPADEGEAPKGSNW